MNQRLPTPPYSSSPWLPALHLALILGCETKACLRSRVACWLQTQLMQQGDLIINVVDSRQWRVGRQEKTSSVTEPCPAETSIQLADAFVVMLSADAHPEEAALFLKLVYDTSAGWRTKPVGFVTYGGEAADSTFIDRLRLQLAEQHAMPLGHAISVENAYERFGLEGKLYASLGEPQRLTRLLAQLKWWASALRKARLESAYEQADQPVAAPTC